jgi:ATP-dependent exoDNAse (exonuclease V) beta subunit
LAPINETGTDKEPAYNYIRELEKEAEDIESGRLFYVAATRAKQRLHLLACAKCDEENTAKEPSKRSLLAKIWWQAQEHFGPAPEDLKQATEPEPIHDVLRRLPADFAIPGAPVPVKWYVPEGGGQEEQIEFSWAGETAKRIGSVVHRWLDLAAQPGLQPWDEKFVRLQDGAVRRQLLARGVETSELPRATARVLEALSNASKSARAGWIFADHPRARSEYQIVAKVDGRIRRFVVDRVIESKSQERWIIDFKTSSHEGAGLDAFLDQEQERYRSKLETYARSVFPSQAVKVALYFPVMDAWREWTVPK